MFKIIKSNMQKAKTGMITLIALLTLASMLLNIGLTVAMSINSFFEDNVEQLNAPDVLYYIGGTTGTDAFANDLRALPEVEKIEFEACVLSAGVSIQNNDLDISNSFLFLNAGESNKKVNSISLPLSFRDSYGFNIDDTITMNISDRVKTYTIDGFFEDIYFGASAVTLSKAYLSDDAYRTLKDELSPVSSSGKLISFYGIEATTADVIFSEINKAIDYHHMDGFKYGLTLEMAKTNDFMFVNILVMVMIGFSLIMVIVSLIVIAFSIISGIEDGIQNIGVLKSLGYKNAQIISVLVMQYGGLAALGSIFGVSGSLLLLPGVGKIAAESSGLLWQLSGNIFAITISFASVCALVVIISVLCAAKTKKITPIVALRNGLETHNFKRNYFPLANYKMNVSLNLVLKSIFQNIKQNVMIFIIVVALTFASVFSILMYRNMVEDRTALLNLIGVPLSDIWFMINDRSVDFDAVFEEIDQMEQVVNTVKYEQIQINLLDVPNVNLFISDDHENMPRMTVKSGRYPIHDNEISMSGIVLKNTGKGLGDAVSVTLRGKTEEYLICGITEQLADNGLSADMTEAGVQRLIKDYNVNGVVAELADGVDVKEFSSQLKKRYTGIGADILDIQTTLNNITLSFAGGTTILMGVVMGIMAMVITLILFLIIRMKILRDKTNIGIFKATGFTTLQIMTHMSLSFTSVVFVGTIIGALLGGLYSNQFVALLLSSMGVSNVNFTMNYMYILYLIIGMTLLAFIVSNWVAFRIRRITAYNLLVE